MQRDRERVEELAEVARRRIGRLAAALRGAQARGEVVPACEPEAVAHFLVASLEGAALVSKLTRDLDVMERCMSELNRYLGSVAIAASPDSPAPWSWPCRSSVRP